MKNYILKGDKQMTKEEQDKFEIDIQKIIDKNGGVFFKDQYDAFIESNKKENKSIEKELEEIMEKKTTK